jgi:hypothetical protein
MANVFYAAETSRRRPERRRTPPELLIARAPACHAQGVCFQPHHHALDQGRGLEAHTQLGEHVEPVERERFLQPFRQACHCRPIHHAEFAMGGTTCFSTRPGTYLFYIGKAVCNLQLRPQASG